MKIFYDETVYISLLGYFIILLKTVLYVSFYIVVFLFMWDLWVFYGVDL